MAPSRGIQTIRSYAYFQSRTCAFSATVVLRSGHNRWSKIKHDKGKNDAAKNRQRSLFAQEISSASRIYGPDPDSNPRLADVIVKAKREGFAKSSIEAAIARGQGRSLSGEKLESLTIEGILPGNVGVMIECETDNKARTLTAVRHALKDAGGIASPSAFLFERKGQVLFEGQPGKRLEEIMDVALDAGATDIEEHVDGDTVVVCEPGDTTAVADAVSNVLELQIKASAIVWKPLVDTMVEIEHEGAKDLGIFVDELHDMEPGVSVTMNISRGNLDDESWTDLNTRLNI